MPVQDTLWGLSYDPGLNLKLWGPMWPLVGPTQMRVCWEGNDLRVLQVVVGWMVLKVGYRREFVREIMRQPWLLEYCGLLLGGICNCRRRTKIIVGQWAEPRWPNPKRKRKRLTKSS